MNNIPNSARRDIQHLSDFSNTHRRIHFAYFFCLAVRKFRLWMVSSVQPVATMLSVSILRIFKICSKPKMIRVNASRVVTTVANYFPVWDRTIVQFPRNTMSAIYFPSCRIRESAVSPELKCRPFPTGTCLSDFLPERMFNCLSAFMVAAHSLCRYTNMKETCQYGG